MPDPMMDPVEFAGMVEPGDIQPYQRNLLRFVGLDVAKDPTDETRLIIYDRAQVNRALTPRLTFISTPFSRTEDYYAMVRRSLLAQPLTRFPFILDDGPTFIPPRPGPSATDLARWEDDGGR